MARYTIEKAAELGTGGGANGSGKRQRVYGYYVVNPHGKRVAAFTVYNNSEKSMEWARGKAQSRIDDLNRYYGL